MENARAEEQDDANLHNVKTEHGVESSVVTDAMSRNDWYELRKLSLRPGGFGKDRRKVWPYLLNAAGGRTLEDISNSLHPPLMATSGETDLLQDIFNESSDLEEKTSRNGHFMHPDHNQIKLDTDRSFVYYPVDSLIEREVLQSDLNQLINDIFSSRPRLNYFQGYHDIITVLYLTLDEEDRLACCEKLSLHRLRDYMGRGLEPLVGLLKIMQRVLRLADPEFASLLARNTPLPYFALSNLLTLFSHDTPTLPQIQCIFDYLFCRNPIASVYLAAAIVLIHRDEAFHMEEIGEEGMLHSLLSSLPDFDGEMGNENSEHNFDSELTSISQLDSDYTDMSASMNLGDMVHLDLNDDLKRFQLMAKSTSSVDQSELLIHQDEPDSCIEVTEREKIESSSLLVSESENQSRFGSPSATSTISKPVDSVRRKPRVLLTNLFTQADNLYERFPPSHPEVHIKSIMGPRSVLLTWCEDPSQMESDDEAEHIVSNPELIVLPEIGPGQDSSNDQEKDSKRKGRRKLRKNKRFLERRTLVAGTVLMLGIAIAMYGMRLNGSTGFYFVRTRNDRGWRRIGQWASGIILGAGETIWDALKI